jgi:hypothetical protein
MFDFIYSQLTSYSIPSWVVFVAVTYFAARYLPLWGVLVGHLLVGLIVAVLDIHWVQTEATKPDYSRTPDMDIVFHAGVLIRIIAINVILLPVATFGAVVHYFRKANPDVL